MTNAMLEAPGNVKASLSTVTEAVHYAEALGNPQPIRSSWQIDSFV